jgi:hypothetical protein
MNKTSRTNKVLDNGEGSPEGEGPLSLAWMEEGDTKEHGLQDQ